MKAYNTIIVLGTFDSKAEEHSFLKRQIEQRGMPALTINVGTRKPSPVKVDLDLFDSVRSNGETVYIDRDATINTMVNEAKILIRLLYDEGKVGGIISAGGGSGTHICTRIMRELPLKVPKVMVSTEASRDMSDIVSTKNITMMHSVADLLGVNSISGRILDQAAGAICGMVRSHWQPADGKKRIALPFFGFIAAGAEFTRQALESRGYEVVSFHANGTGGTAMEELAAEGYFDGILDLATHELADHLLNGYCGAIGAQRFEPVPKMSVPRLVVPGGMDCAILEFTRHNVPERYRDRQIFFHGYRSAIRLNRDESANLANQLAEKLNRGAADTRILVPLSGWSEAARQGGALYDPEMDSYFIAQLREALDPQIGIHEVDHHINDEAFGLIAAELMDKMVQKTGE
jgi:uncharacterized protein (UPF0261 family)